MDDSIVKADERKAVRLAAAILDGTLPPLLGCRQLLPAIERLGIDRDEPFIGLVGVESETDHLPFDPDERGLWSPAALVDKDVEIARATEWARPIVFAACEAILHRFGEIAG